MNDRLFFFFLCLRMVGGIRLASTLGEVVKLIRRRRWPNSVKFPYCGSVKNGRSARRLYA
ncbi:MAG: hypothetical protein QXK12_00540 [Candidatus Nezhaarchaeales archaeon]